MPGLVKINRRCFKFGMIRFSPFALLIGLPVVLQALSSKHVDFSKADWNNKCLSSRSRRKFLLLSTLPILTPSVAQAVAPRDVDVGGGFDLLGKPKLAAKDVPYPPSMEGPWICNRVVTQVEGDSFQAESAWKALGGARGSLKANAEERYETRYVKSNFLFGDEAMVVVDRGFEMAERTKNPDVAWNVDLPDVLGCDKYRISVVQRAVEPPSDQGFGFNELYRIDDGLVTRAVRVKRRYRRAFDDAGNRVVEGLEIMKTFRVLDGVAGTEIPTSTVRVQLRLTRQ